MNNITKKKINEHLLKILLEYDRVCRENDLNYILIGGTLLGAVRHGGFIPWDDDVDVAMPREDFEKLIKNADKLLAPGYSLKYYCKAYKYWLPFAKIQLNGTVYQEANIKNKEIKNGFWIDVFPLDYTNNDRRSKLKQKKKIIRVISSILFNKNSKKISDVHFLKKIAYMVFWLIPNSFLFRIRERIMQSENDKHCDYFINYGSQYDVERQTHLIKNVLPTDEIRFEKGIFLIPNNPDYVLTNIYGANYMKLPPKNKRITHNPSYIKFESGEEVFFDVEE